MGVISEAWWGIWWPWMLVWLLTAGCLAALLVLTVLRLVRFVRGRRPDSRPATFSICFYLHGTTVMDHYQMRGYAAALRREVEQRTSDSAEGNVRASAFGATLGGGRRDTMEVVSKYLQVAEPISVIGVIMDVLEKEDVIVHVDLANGTVRHNRALAAGAGPGAGASPRTVRLRDIEDFVLIRGRFRKISESSETTVFEAPYGDPDLPGEGPRVRVTCATEGLRTGVGQGTFLARCLGKVQDWNARDAVLEVQAMAIFR
ncbi:hypothetical protein [Streptomyces sp. GMY02]|uniref:hypothetical protein n=1 Tax=Streptomyces sp. GMY02 TaxID=1333528 RepID=UPI0020B80636|nr:hypothetical protein [Streptomyces sp. GMY02]